MNRNDVIHGLHKVMDVLLTMETEIRMIEQDPNTIVSLTNLEKQINQCRKNVELCQRSLSESR